MSSALHGFEELQLTRLRICDKCHTKHLGVTAATQAAARPTHILFQSLHRACLCIDTVNLAPRSCMQGGAACRHQ